MLSVEKCRSKSAFSLYFPSLHQFRFEDFSLEDQQRFGCPVELDGEIKTFIDTNYHSIRCRIVEKLAVPYMWVGKCF